MRLWFFLRFWSLLWHLGLPVVLLYQGWTYWVFRERVSARSRLEY